MRANSRVSTLYLSNGPKWAASGQWREIKGSEKFYPGQLVLLALGFLGPQDQCIKALQVEQDPRSNIKTARGVSAGPLKLEHGADARG